MIKDLTLETFLERNNIDDEAWKKANIEWSTLQEIACDHEAECARLENSAELFAKEIQKFHGVHSVRWRVKDSEHLIEKIVRKRSEGNEKYKDISRQNYFELVTDLVGVRALHLFKADCFGIDAALKAVWNPIEVTVAYIREGDSEDLRRRFEERGFEVRHHPAGYRSVHYVIESVPLKRKIIAEIQVRTIFEEGWSEIDHTIRYPHFSDNELIRYFLEIFNRMAGSADDMGGFVLGLVATVDHLEEEISSIKKEKEAVFKDMEKALSQLESVKEQDKASKQSIATLKAEVAKLKGSSDSVPAKAEDSVPARTITKGDNLFEILASPSLSKSLVDFMKAYQTNYKTLSEHMKAYQTSNTAIPEYMKVYLTASNNLSQGPKSTSIAKLAESKGPAAEPKGTDGSASK